MTNRITRTELQALVERKAATLVEALPEKYWRDGHLPGALNLPHDEVESRAAAVLPDKDATLVVYCASVTCRNSGIAGERLRALGYRDVREYAEGKADWSLAGLALEQAP